MRENPDNAPEKQDAYKEMLKGLDDHQLFEESGKKIWLSAYANNNPISCYHWQCKACYVECADRGKEDIYSRAHKAQMKACGY